MKHPQLHQLISTPGNEEAALQIIDKVLAEDMDDAEALFALGQYYVRQENYPVAYLMFRRVTELMPDHPSAWSNMGLCKVCLDRPEDSRSFFKQALRLDPYNAGALANLGLLASNDCDYSLALDYCNKLLGHRDHNEARVTRAFAHLALGHWREGWRDYTAALQTKYRIDIDYGLPRWGGRVKATVIVHGEQGLGDEIMYASCIPDLAKRIGWGNVILDVDARLAHWFRRSFPNARVYGDRRAEHRPWLAGSGATHSLAIGELPRFFRPDGPTRAKSYLVPNPELKFMYRALQRGRGECPCIGLCWSGGTRGTKASDRTINMDAIKSIMAAYPNARFFSLEYNPESAARGKPLGITHHHFAVGAGSSYDHTSAYIAALDLVIGTDTTAHHAAGAMGVPSRMIITARPLWLNSDIHGDTHGWYETVKLFRGTRSESISDTAKRYALSIDQQEKAA